MLLKNNIDRGTPNLSDLEKMGCIQAFEMTFELSWKVMKDYLAYSGVTLEQMTPRYIIKKAHSARIIKDGNTWLKMLENRNLTAHTYDEAHILEGLNTVEKIYLPHMTDLYALLKEEANG